MHQLKNKKHDTGNYKVSEKFGKTHTVLISIFDIFKLTSIFMHMLYTINSLVWKYHCSVRCLLLFTI